MSFKCLTPTCAQITDAGFCAPCKQRVDGAVTKFLSAVHGQGLASVPVPEVRYDVHGTAIHYEKPGRYRGLLAHEASALSDALYHDLPGSSCLLTLRKRWAERAAWEAEDEATSVEMASW